MSNTFARVDLPDLGTDNRRVPALHEAADASWSLPPGVHDEAELN